MKSAGYERVKRRSFQLRFHLIEQPTEGVWLEGPRPRPGNLHHCVEELAGGVRGAGEIEVRGFRTETGEG
ncbi:MAG TPA: hypothetical protein VF969_06545 [Burkholderiales bacterium]